MNCLRLSLFVVMFAALSACASDRHCDKRKLYISAQTNAPVAVPEDLDAPAANKELVIPEPSPSPPRDEDAGCVESPPLLPASIE